MNNTSPLPFATPVLAQNDVFCRRGEMRSVTLSTEAKPMKKDANMLNAMEESLDKVFGIQQ